MHDRYGVWQGDGDYFRVSSESAVAERAERLVVRSHPAHRYIYHWLSLLPVRASLSCILLAVTGLCETGDEPLPYDCSFPSPCGGGPGRRRAAEHKGRASGASCPAGWSCC